MIQPSLEYTYCLFFFLPSSRRHGAKTPHFDVFRSRGASEEFLPRKDPSMAEIGRSISGKDIPPAVNAEYQGMHISVVLLIVLSQTGAFWGCFFGGSRDDDGNWQPAWWAFGLIGAWFWPFQIFPKKYVREGTRLKAFSWSGSSIDCYDLSQIEKLEIVLHCGQQGVRLETTEECYAERAKGVCGCCAKRTEILCLARSSMEAFLADHGLAGSDNNTAPTA